VIFNTNQKGVVIMRKNMYLSVCLVLFLFLISSSVFAATEILDRGYSSPENLISCEELKNIIGNEDVKIIDFRSNVDYITGHIPGAIQIGRDEFEDGDAKYDYIMASPEKIENLLREKGIKNNDLIVAYDNTNNLWSSRVWWILKMYGHDNVKLLDGALGRWEELNYETKLVEFQSFEESDYQIEEINKNMVANMDEVENAIDRDDSLILDVRAWGEYTGEVVLDGAAMGGRIPSSVWIEWTEVLNDDGTFKNAAELKEIYQEKGVDPDKVIYPYCQGAIRSCHTTFVLKSLLGYPEVKNYDGSWVEWSNENMPVATGENTK
jgi:thiosulfate/3-mercaptopyruvate sulfurtransferase